MSSPAVVEQILDRADLYPAFDTSNLDFNERYGFVEVRDEEVAAAGMVRLLGFWNEKDGNGKVNDYKNVIEPIVDFNALPEHKQTLAAQSKGVGPRLHTVHQSLAGATDADLPSRIEVCTVDLRRAAIIDRRSTQGGPLKQQVKYIGTRLLGKIQGDAEVVAGIHALYGFHEAEAVELRMPPNPERRRQKRGVENPKGVSPNFMIIRKRHVPLQRVGSVATSWTV